MTTVQNGFPSAAVVGKCRSWIEAMGSPGWSAAADAREIVAELGSEEVAGQVFDLLCTNPDGMTYGEAVAAVLGEDWWKTAANHKQ